MNIYSYSLNIQLLCCGSLRLQWWEVDFVDRQVPTDCCCRSPETKGNMDFGVCPRPKCLCRLVVCRVLARSQSKPCYITTTFVSLGPSLRDALKCYAFNLFKRGQKTVLRWASVNVPIVLYVVKGTVIGANTRSHPLWESRCPHPLSAPPLLLPLIIVLSHWCLLLSFLFVCLFYLNPTLPHPASPNPPPPVPVFVIIMTSRCFNFRFAYPLPLLPHLHTARMASGHPTDKFSFMYQPDTHKRYGTRMYTHPQHAHTRRKRNTHTHWSGKLTHQNGGWKMGQREWLPCQSRLQLVAVPLCEAMLLALFLNSIQLNWRLTFQLLCRYAAQEAFRYLLPSHLALFCFSCIFVGRIPFLFIYIHIYCRNVTVCVVTSVSCLLRVVIGWFLEVISSSRFSSVRPFAKHLADLKSLLFPTSWIERELYPLWHHKGPRHLTRNNGFMLRHLFAMMLFFGTNSPGEPRIGLSDQTTVDPNFYFCSWLSLSSVHLYYPSNLSLRPRSVFHPLSLCLPVKTGYPQPWIQSTVLFSLAPHTGTPRTWPLQVRWRWFSFTSLPLEQDVDEVRV